MWISGRLRALAGTGDQRWLAGLGQGELSTLEPRVEWMDGTGIDIQVLSPPPFLALYDSPVGEAWRASRRLNEGIAEAIDGQRDRFRGYATVPLQHPQTALRELRHAVETLGLDGVQLLTHVGDWELDDTRLDVVWDLIAELDLTVFLHPFGTTDAARLDHHYLGNCIGNPHETTIAAARLVFGGVFDRHPHLRVILSHNGGGVRAVWGRWRHASATIPEAAVQRSDLDEYRRHLFLDSIAHDPLGLRHSIEWAGPDHVVVGSDFPFDMGDRDPVASIGAALRETDLDIRRVTDGTALL